MNLVIDRGNTRTKIYLFKQNEVVEKNIFLNEEEQSILKKIEQYKHCKKIISSSAHIPSTFDVFQFLILKNTTKIPIRLHYETPKTLGTDRIALAVGANYLFPQKNVLIVGTGTCITIDFIDQNAIYQGGIITPGLQMRMQALHHFTDKLPLIKRNHKQQKYTLTGKTTTQSMQSGVFNGTFAEVDGIISQYKAIYNDLTIILTGGDQEIFVNNLKNDIFAHSNIQAIGLNQILNYNFNA